MKLLQKTLFIIFFYVNLTYSYKICALKKHENICGQLERNNRIKCEYVDNEASCLIKIDSGEIDFGSINAETAFLGNGLISNVVPFAQIIPETARNVEFDYETVVVSEEKFESLEGLSYCHPGFENTLIPPLILKEFEQHVFKKYSNHCDTEFETSVEWEIFALNKIFGDSCRDGVWTPDKKLDEHLHDKYPGLIKLCPNLNGDPLERSLQCMLNTKHSIALTTSNTINNKINTTNKALWYYCKNGTVSNTPCSWSKQPYPILIMSNHQSQPGNLENTLKKWLSREVFNKDGSEDSESDLDEKDLRYLKEILNNNKELNNVVVNYKLFNDNTSNAWGNFIKSFRDIPSPDDSIICKRKMRWCTTSDNEQTKCKWLSQASINYGIQPVVECVQKSSELECLKAISNNNESADLITTSADLGYAAKKYGLSAIAFPETYNNQEINTLLLVKNDRNIERLENLKGKKGCFPLYSGIAWLSFVEATRGIVLSNESCDYGKLLSDFLGDSCMPGAIETNRAIHNTVDSEKMCKLCTETGKTCEASEATNLYFNTSGALRCLEEKGDFAVIVKDPSLVFPNNVQVMCKNGTFSTLDAFNVDEGCYLSTLTTSEVITRINDPLNKDIQLALLQYDEWFAAKTHTPFRLFDSFNNTKDLLFKDSTPGLAVPTSQKPPIKNYVELFKHIGDCSKGSGVADNPSKGIRSITFVTTTLLIFTTIIMNLF
nr:transferrin-like [Onthophagus taurus]